MKQYRVNGMVVILYIKVYSNECPLLCIDRKQKRSLSQILRFSKTRVVVN